MKFQDKNLLVISLGYPYKDIPHCIFVKTQVDELKKYFKEIYVIAPLPFFPEFLGKFKFFRSLFRDFSKMKNYSYDNVKIFFPKYLTFPANFFRKRIGNYAYKVALKCIKKNNLDFGLIHAHFTWPSGYVAVKLKEVFGKNVVLTVHEDRDWLSEEYNSKDKKLIHVWETSDLIIRVNQKDLPLFKEYNKNSINIPNGFSSDHFKKLSNNLSLKLNLPKDKKVILNIASYKIIHKNQLNLVKALVELKKKRDDFVAYFIGNNAGDKKKIVDLVKKLNAVSYITILDTKLHSEVPLWMNAADVFVLPSYTESFGVVNIEALACGTPVVSTINGGSEEIITSEDYGFLLEDPNDYMGLSELIDKALNKKWDTEKIISYAQMFSYKNVVELIINQYKSILK